MSTDKLYGVGIIQTGMFGSGTDGDVIINGTRSLTKTMNYNNLTISSKATLNTNGFAIYVRNQLILDGTVQNHGHDAIGSVGGSGAISNCLGGGTLGGDGTSQWYGGNGGGISADGNGNVGGVGGSYGPYLGGQPGPISPIPNFEGGPYIMSIYPYVALGRTTYGDMIHGGTGGGGGGAGEGSIGGGGGGGAGLICISARNITGSGLISVRGGNGSKGSGSDAGGGAGGGAGVVGIVSLNDVKLGTSIRFDISGGKGADGIGNGEKGHDGESGSLYLYC